MAYLVTGGTGLIGARIVRDIVREGKQAIAYDLYPDRTMVEQLLDSKEKELVKIITGDVTDLPHLIHTVQDNKVDKIIHIAGLLSDASKAIPYKAMKINCEGTVNIFETARILGLSKVVWSSSIGVFGTEDRYPEGYIANDAPHYPHGVYGACKSFNESMAIHYCEAYDMDIIGLRYCFVYGAGQKSGESASVVRELVEKPALGKPGKVPFSDDTVNWIYVDDAARATMMAANSPKTKTKAFTVGGYRHSLREVAAYIKSIVPGADITLQPGLIGISSKYETTPIKEQIGFVPQWTMERGMKDMVNNIRKQAGLPLV